MWVICLNVFLCCTCLHCPKRSQEGILSSVTGVTEGCEPPFGWVDHSLGTLQEQSYSENFIKLSEECVPVTHLLYFELCLAEYSEVSVRCSAQSTEGAAFIIHLINQHVHFLHLHSKYFSFPPMWKDADVYVTSFIQGWYIYLKYHGDLVLYV